jgi:lipopolysaccharide export system permease protein
MLFEKSLRRDITNLAGVVFASLFAIFLTTSVIRLLGRAAGGKIDTTSVLPFIAYSSVVALPALLVLTLYVAVLLAVGRAWRDSEMVIWFSAGRSLGAWIGPVARLAIPWVVLIAMISFVGAPWANRQMTELRQRFDAREDVAQIAPGRFRESVAASRVFFVESVDESRGTVGNVFVASRRGDAVTVLASAAGRIEQIGSERFLVLEKGRQYDGPLSLTPQVPLVAGERDDGRSFRVLEFERYGLRLEQAEPPTPERIARNLTTMELLRDPTRWNLGEVAWRFGLPMAAVWMVLLAIPLSYVNPRTGRTGNLIVALLVCIVYFNLMTIGSVWIAQGKVSVVAGTFLPHLVLALTVAWLFSRHLRLESLPSWVLRQFRGRWGQRPTGASGVSHS